MRFLFSVWVVYRCLRLKLYMQLYGWKTWYHKLLSIFSEKELVYNFVEIL